MRPLAVDTETAPIRPGCIVPELACVTFCGQGYAPILAPEEGAATVLSAIENGYLLIGHFVAYDMAVICRQDPKALPTVWRAYENGQVWDTMIFAQLRAIRFGEYRDEKSKRPPFDLASLVRVCLGRDMDKGAVRLGFGDLIGVPIAQWPVAAVEYAVTDAAETMALFEWQQKHLGEIDLDDFRRQCHRSFAAHLTAARGLRTDLNEVARVRDEMTARVEKHLTTAKEHGFIRENGTKDMAAIKAALVAAGCARPVKRKDGSLGDVSTEREQLEASGHPGLLALAAAGKDQKNLTTYLPMLDTPWPVCCRYDLLATGRMSASKPYLQSLPREGSARRCIVPRPGYLFAGADYSALEMVTLAQVCLNLFGSSRLAEALQAGLDPHLVVAADLLHCTYADCAAHKTHPTVKEHRQLAKALNFGLPGGLGAEKFVDFARAQYDVTLTIEQAKALKQRWLALYPEIRLYHRMASDTEKAGGLVKQIGGRWRGRCRYTEAANTLFQGLAADGALDAVVALQYECRLGNGPLKGSYPVLFVHDEIAAEVPEDRAREAAEALGAVMVRAMGKWCPDVPVKAEPWLMRRWGKGESVRGPDGALVVGG